MKTAQRFPRELSRSQICNNVRMALCYKKNSKFENILSRDINCAAYAEICSRMRPRRAGTV